MEGYAPPESIRRASSFMHNLIGVIIGSAAVLALLREGGIFVNILVYLSSALLTISGAFLALPALPPWNQKP